MATRPFYIWLESCLARFEDSSAKRRYLRCSWGREGKVVVLMTALLQSREEWEQPLRERKVVFTAPVQISEK